MTAYVLLLIGCQNISQQPNGFIEGSISYPSEEIPKNLKICATNLQTNKRYCTKERITEPKYTYGLGYQLKVPPGNYKVYAYLLDNPDNKAYYNEFVACGMNIECPSHETIVIAVSSGVTTSNIDPIDWYR